MVIAPGRRRNPIIAVLDGRMSATDVEGEYVDMGSPVRVFYSLLNCLRVAVKHLPIGGCVSVTN